MHARIALAIAVVLLETFPQAQEPPPAQVSVRGRPAQPGSVLEITVRGGDGLSDPKGTAFGRPLVFLAGPEPRVWRTLVGVDVATLAAGVEVDDELSSLPQPAATSDVAARPAAMTRRSFMVDVPPQA